MATQLVNGRVVMLIYSADPRDRELNYVQIVFPDGLTESNYYFYVVFNNTMKNLTNNDTEIEMFLFIFSY